MSNGVPMNSYLSPEAAAMMAGIEDPKDRMNTMGGMQTFANQLPAMNRIKERDNGRVVGRTSLMEGLGQAGSQIAGAYMNKQLMDKYGALMDKNNASRQDAALRIAQALRRPDAGAQPGAVAPSAAMPSGLTPHEVDYYGG
jgi:hypothetical protein